MHMKHMLQRMGSLRSQLIGAMLLLALVPMILGGAVYFLSTQALEQTAVEMAGRTLSDKMASLDTFYRDVNLILQDNVDMAEMLDYLLPLSSLRTYSIERAQSNLTAKLDSLILNHRRSIDSLCILPQTEDRQMIYKRSLMARIEPIYRYRDYAVDTRTLQSPLPVWTCDLSDADNPFLCASLRVYSAQRDRALGVMMIMLNAEYFTSLVDRRSEEIATRYLLADEMGTPMYAADEQLLTLSPPEEGTYAYVSIDGDSHLLVSAVSRVSGWRLTCVVPFSQISYRLERIPWLIMMAVPIFIAAAIFSGTLLYRQVYRPIRELAKAMDAFTLSTELNIRPFDELDELEKGFAHMKERIAALIEDVRLESENRQRQEIEALQMQIMPHFLFNTLNAVKALIALDQNARATEMLVAFTGLLRVSIGDSRDCIALNEEINYLRQYVLIMSMRGDASIRLAVDIDERWLQCLVPKHILQPLAENSILHGFAQHAGERENTIRLTAAGSAGRLLLTVSDNGGGIDEETLARIRQGLGTHRSFSGIGIHNIDSRIRLLYGDAYGLRIESDTNGVRATITLPVREP